LIRNKDFSAWYRVPTLRARDEYNFKKIREMDEKGLDSIDLDHKDVEVPDTNYR
jgi:hypothetical protein